MQTVDMHSIYPVPADETRDTTVGVDRIHPRGSIVPLSSPTIPAQTWLAPGTQDDGPCNAVLLAPSVHAGGVDECDSPLPQFPG